MAAMDALGIQASLIDEFWVRKDGAREVFPGYWHENGILRAVPSQAQHAANMHPDRFAYVVRTDYRDPEIDTCMRLIADTPHALATRLIVWSEDEVRDFSRGEFGPCFAAATGHGIPIFVYIENGEAAMMEQYLQSFPNATVVLDHVGMVRNAAQFEDVLRLARYPNAALKWCHAPRLFGATAYPFAETETPLRLAVAAYGAKRIMWASDFTTRQHESSWAERLFYIRNSPALTAEDKSWILGRTARTLLNWPRPPAASRQNSDGFGPVKLTVPKHNKNTKPQKTQGT